jgi:hypothetical protein
MQTNYLRRDGRDHQKKNLVQMKEFDSYSMYESAKDPEEVKITFSSSDYLDTA